MARPMYVCETAETFFCIVIGFRLKTLLEVLESGLRYEESLPVGALLGAREWPLVAMCSFRAAGLFAQQ